MARILILVAENRSFIEGAETMTTVTVSTQIAAPVPRAFQLFTDIEHGPAHVSGIKRIEMLTSGQVGHAVAGNAGGPRCHRQCRNGGDLI
jgi:hypothetical protein